jgi:hypothetical protein
VSEDQEFEAADVVATGVAGVDEAVALLNDLDALPTADHVAVYDVVHRRLQDSLADLDGP